MAIFVLTDMFLETTHSPSFIRKALVTVALQCIASELECILKKTSANALWLAIRMSETR